MPIRLLLCLRLFAGRGIMRLSTLPGLRSRLPAEDLNGHVRLSASTSLPIAVGESIYHPSHFREYLQQGGCSIVQADVARIGGITPWLKVAHLAESFNVAICPHFLMELHVSLCGAVPNAAWVEWIPQLDDVTHSRMEVKEGRAICLPCRALALTGTGRPLPPPGLYAIRISA